MEMEMESCGDYDSLIYASNSSVLCPKPRRFCPPFTITDQNQIKIKPSICLQSEVSDSRPQLFDIILSMGDKSTGQVASSPPFFFGSPPSRVSNPVIEDSRFGCDRATPVSPSVARAMSPSSSGCRGGSFSRAKYGNKPAPVRIEGFNFLSVA